MKDTTLKQFVRDRDGQPRGMVIATVIDDSIRIGWSYTNTSKGDKFNKQMAFAIALGRAEYGWGKTVKVPNRVQNVYNKMTERAKNYYKELSYKKIPMLSVLSTDI